MDSGRQQHVDNYIANFWSGLVSAITFAYLTVSPTTIIAGLPIPAAVDIQSELLQA